MNELAQERSHIHATIVKSALVTHHIASNMNELTQGRSHIHASIVNCALVSRQTARNTKRETRKSQLFKTEGT